MSERPKYTNWRPLIEFWESQQEACIRAKRARSHPDTAHTIENLVRSQKITHCVDVFVVQLLAYSDKKAGATSVFFLFKEYISQLLDNTNQFMGTRYQAMELQPGVLFFSDGTYVKLPSELEFGEDEILSWAEIAAAFGISKQS